MLYGSMAFGQLDTQMTVCSSKSEIGRCIGSANCTACRNCSACGHCNSGGSCGVCSRRRSSVATPKAFSNAERELYNLSDDETSEYYLRTLVVDSNVLNVRTGPGKDYSIIAKYAKDDELIFLASKGNWIKVRKKSGGKTGFIYADFVHLGE